MSFRTSRIIIVSPLFFFASLYAGAAPYISEFAAENSAFEDEDLGEPDWIELHNPDAEALSLKGWRLAIGEAPRDRWTIPAITIDAEGFVLIFASGKDRAHTKTPPHAGFKLRKSGGRLALLSPKGETVSAFAYGPQIDGVSYGKLGARTGYLGIPTPGEPNVGPIARDLPGPSVRFSSSGGLIAAPLDLSMDTSSDAASSIRFTTDGSVPTESSQRYESPVPISGTTLLRARTFPAGHLPGPIASASFVWLGDDLRTFTSNLPLVVVDTAGVDVDLAWNPRNPRPFRPATTMCFGVAGREARARLADAPQFLGRSGIHVRGRSSAGFPKKQYALEIRDERDEDRNASLLGFPKESDYILHAPYSDKTLMRNVLVYGLAREIAGPAAGVETRFVELFRNEDGGALTMDDYAGVYVLMEKIKRDKHRVNIRKLGPFTIAPERIDGGYLFKRDGGHTGTVIETDIAGIRLEIVHPKIPHPQQSAFLDGYISRFEESLRLGTPYPPDSTYRSFIDSGSFVLNHLLVEMFRNPEGLMRSTYYHKDRGGKIRALPVWDYNLSLGNAPGSDASPVGWHHTGGGRPVRPDPSSGWYGKLFEDSDFTLAYWDRYFSLRSGLLSTDRLMARIDKYAALLVESQARNFQRWKILGTYVFPNPRGFEHRTTHADEVAFMKAWITRRLAWMDRQHPAPPVISATPSGFTLAPSATHSATATIYYSLDGADPRADLPSRKPPDIASLIGPGSETFVFSPSDQTPNPGKKWAMPGETRSKGAWMPCSANTLRRSRSELRRDLETRGSDSLAMPVFWLLPFQLSSDDLRDARSPSSPFLLRSEATDGFHLYLNGTPIASLSASREQPDQPATSQLDLSGHGNLLREGENVLALRGLRIPGETSHQSVWTLCLELQRIDMVSSNAIRYARGQYLERNATIRARSFDGKTWSALAAAN